ncbi:hypothetical protein J4450_07560 [Candidatus Micrarchaeota archaeon]|nr:hypothetical protein [Candidatus Micrarchaeota archaeon]
MLKAKLVYLKDKQFFEKVGTLRLVGKPIETAKKLKDQGFELLHIIDLDAQRGIETNFDVYDKLTYLMHVQVECDREEFIERLLGINARVVIILPTKLDLKKFKDKNRLLVGKIKNDYTGEISDVYDLIIEDAKQESVKKFSKLGKRILVYAKDFKKEMEKFTFAIIESL